jgi:hypothetical protein
MKNRKDLEKPTVPPKTTGTYSRGYDSHSGVVLGYDIDIPEHARHLVRVERKKTGADERGVEFFIIRNDASGPAFVTFFEFEE